MSKHSCNYKIKMKNNSLKNIEDLKSKFRSKADLYAKWQSNVRDILLFTASIVHFSLSSFRRCPIRFMKDILSGGKKVAVSNANGDLVIDWPWDILHQSAKVHQIRSQSNVLEAKIFTWCCRTYSRFIREWTHRRKVLLDERAIDPLKQIKYKIKIMVLLGFEPWESPLPFPAPVPTPSPWIIQISNPIKLKDSLALILKDLKSKKANAYFSCYHFILISISSCLKSRFQTSSRHQTAIFLQRDSRWARNLSETRLLFKRCSRELLNNL